MAGQATVFNIGREQELLFFPIIIGHERQNIGMVEVA